jgi:hypothetical protein
MQISSLKGDQVSAQGFNAGLGNSRRCALKGHHDHARHIGSKSFAHVSSFSRHFQGAFLRGRYPWLKPGLGPFAPSGRRPPSRPYVEAQVRRRIVRKRVPNIGG